MMKRRTNPFTMRGHLRRCWLFTWRTPKADACALLPAPLEPVTRGGFAFWNVVVCEMRAMRPAPLPAAIGLGYWHVAYRLHARVRLESGEIVEGLYFVRSDCDRSLVTVAGNLLTDFRFHTARVAVHADGAAIEGRINASGGDAHFRLGDAKPALTTGSPFTSVAEAAEFLKYKPCAIAPSTDGLINVVRVTRREADWRYRIVTVVESDWDFLSGREIAPEVCYSIEPIDYQWERAEVRRVAP